MQIGCKETNRDSVLLSDIVGKAGTHQVPFPVSECRFTPRISDCNDEAEDHDKDELCPAATSAAAKEALFVTINDNMPDGTHIETSAIGSLHQEPQFLGIGPVFPSLCSDIYSVVPVNQYASVYRMIMMFWARSSTASSESSLSDVDRHLAVRRSQIKDDAFENISLPLIETLSTFQDLRSSVLQTFHRTAALRRIVPGDPPINEIEITLLAERIETFQEKLKVFAFGPPLWTRKPLRHNRDKFPGQTPITGLTEPVYGYLLLVTYQLLIALSVITDLKFGPSSPERVEAATELCKLYAVLQFAPPECFEIPILSSLLAAGMTFSPMSHPDEYAWIYKKFDKLKWKYPNAMYVQGQLNKIWIDQFAGNG